MKKFIQYALLSVGFLSVLGLVLWQGYNAEIANANPTTFCYDATSGSTTTPQYLDKTTAATSTVTTANCAGATRALDSAVVLVQFTPSTTPATLNLRFEASFDNVEWYPIGNALGTNSTTTKYSMYAQQQWNIATSTGLDGSSLGMRIYNTFTLPVVAPYIRVKANISDSNGNGSVWMQIIGKRQNQ